MEITIGKITKEVDRVIYISPKGSDDNDGLSKKTPLLRLDYAINYIVSLGGGAICFMEGEHDFTDQKQYQSDNSNNSFFRDFDYTNSSYGSVKIIFYAEKPSDTLLKCISTYVKGYNRTQFIYLINKESGLYNLNLLLQSNIKSSSSYDGVFTIGNKNEIYDCIFDINCPGWNYANMVVSAHGGTDNFIGCIFKGLNAVVPGTSGTTFNSCIFSNTPSSGYDSNCVIDSSIEDMSIKELLKITTSDGNLTGLMYSDYCNWKDSSINKILISKITDSNNITPEDNILDIGITDKKELYITDIDNNLIKIIHSHTSLDDLNKFSMDENNNFLYDNKIIALKNHLTTDDIKYINYKIFRFPDE